MLDLPVLAFCLFAVHNQCFALGTETFGNKTLHDPAYEQWPNLVSVINDTNRIYQYWVNGGEKFFFQGNTESFNAALQRFATVKADAREVVLLPGPATVSSLLQEKTFDYDWSLEINSGISAPMTRGKGGLIWSKDPRLLVYIGGENIGLEKISIPRGVTVLELGDLQKRYTEAIQESDNIHVRGWGACALARLDPSSTGSVVVVTGLLQDTNDWVRLNAVTALKSFGKTATPALPSLRRMAAASDPQLKEETEKAIAAIETAADAPDNQKTDLLKRISLFRKSLPQEK